jgi:TatD DNase family protein
MLIDSHCHLNHDRLHHLGGAGALVDAALAAGVNGMLTINCRISDEFPAVLGVARAHDRVWCTIGTHPHEASDPAEKSIVQDELIRLAQSDPKIIGIGESGLDYFYKHSTVEDQQDSFRKHIRACIACDLPLVVHSRDAEEDTMRIIREEGTGTRLKGVMHCFSSKPSMGDDALDFGFYISFSGIVTFKKSTELQDFCKRVPKDRILVETDSPYLAPEPHRGAINQPAYVAHTNAFIANLHDIGAKQMAQMTTDNFYTLFDRAQR